MAKIKGRVIIGLTEAAHTWQLFDGRLGWKLEIWLDAFKGVVFAMPVPNFHDSRWRVERFGDYRFWNLNTCGNVPSDYKGKIAYLKDAIVVALKRYEGCCDVLSGKEER